MKITGPRLGIALVAVWLAGRWSDYEDGRALALTGAVIGAIGAGWIGVAVGKAIEYRRQVERCVNQSK